MAALPFPAEEAALRKAAALEEAARALAGVPDRRRAVTMQAITRAHDYAKLAAEKRTCLTVAGACTEDLEDFDLDDDENAPAPVTRNKTFFTISIGATTLKVGFRLLNKPDDVVMPVFVDAVLPVLDLLGAATAEGVDCDLSDLKIAGSHQQTIDVCTRFLQTMRCVQIGKLKLPRRKRTDPKTSPAWEAIGTAAGGNPLLRSLSIRFAENTGVVEAKAFADAYKAAGQGRVEKLEIAGDVPSAAIVQILGAFDKVQPSGEGLYLRKLAIHSPWVGKATIEYIQKKFLRGAHGLDSLDLTPENRTARVNQSIALPLIGLMQYASETPTLTALRLAMHSGQSLEWRTASCAAQDLLLNVNHMRELEVWYPPTNVNLGGEMLSTLPRHATKLRIVNASAPRRVVRAQAPSSLQELCIEASTQAEAQHRHTDTFFLALAQHVSHGSLVNLTKLEFSGEMGGEELHELIDHATPATLPNLEHFQLKLGFGRRADPLFTMFKVMQLPRLRRLVIVNPYSVAQQTRSIPVAEVVSAVLASPSLKQLVLLNCLTTGEATQLFKLKKRMPSLESLVIMPSRMMLGAEVPVAAEAAGAPKRARTQSKLMQTQQATLEDVKECLAAAGPFVGLDHPNLALFSLNFTYVTPANFAQSSVARLVTRVSEFANYSPNLTSLGVNATPTLQDTQIKVELKSGRAKAIEHVLAVQLGAAKALKLRHSPLGADLMKHIAAFL